MIRWQPNWTYLCVCIFLLAAALRVWFVMTVQVDGAIRGDATEYVAYAMNMLNHGVFSHQLTADPQPDAFRSPGYPLLVATMIRLSGENWYANLLLVQCILGAVSACMTMYIGSAIMRPAAAVACGVLVAVWPHCVSISGYILTETLFGFLMLLSVLMLVSAINAKARERHALMRWLTVAAGLAAAAAYLVNPMMLVAVVAVGMVLLVMRKPRMSVLFLAVAMLGPVGWSVRNQVTAMPATNADSARAWINLVQGASPEYHVVWHGSLAGNETSIQQMRVIDEAWTGAMADRRIAFAYVADRFKEEPVAMMKWYALDKALLLWDWDIRIGQGDIYVFPTRGGPFESSLIMSAWKGVARRINPVLAWMTLLACVLALVAVLRSRRRPVDQASWLVVAAVTGSMTILHMVFQAEPRYAIPYRPFQFLMCLYAVILLFDAVRERVGRSGTQARVD